ncbi:hypothetical protein BDQ17DRAFT_1346787 [Cyathus striatus]|nr:hypothetical protein BDQ17DRAFT_1346787 [Cyathus striatus]
MLLAFTAGALILLVYTIRAFIVPPKMYKEQIHHGHYRSGSGIPYDSIYEHQDDSAEQERGIALPVLSDGSPSSPSASSMSFTEKRVSANSAARMICSPESHTPLTRQYGRQVSSTQDATENLATSSYQRQNPDIRAARVRAWKILLSLLLAELCILVSGILGLFRLVFQGILGSKTEELLEIVQSALEVLCIGGVMGGYLLHAYNAAYPGAFSRPMLFYVSEQRAGERVRSPYPTSPTSPSPLISSFPLSTPPKAKTTLPKKSPLEPKASGLSAPQSRFAFSRSKSFHVRGRGVQSVSSSFSSPFPRSFKGSAGTGKEVAAATATAVNGGPGWREKAVDIEERRRGLDLSGEPSGSRAQEVVVQMGNMEIEMNRTPSPCAPAIESLPSSIMKRRTSKLMKSRPLSSVPLSGQKSRSTLRRRGTRLPGHMRGSSSPTSPFCPINQAQEYRSEDFTDLRDPFAPPTPGTVPAHTASIGMRMSQASSDSPLVFASESLPSTSTSSLRSTPKGHRMSAWGRLPPLPMPVPSPNAPHPARSLKGVKGVVSGWRKGRGRTKSGSSSIVSSLKGRVNSKAEEEEEVWGTRVDMADEGLGEGGVLEEVLLAQKLLRRLDGASSPAVGGHSRRGSSTI